ncbi:hypothetical protein H5410_008481 [Solanum commersonii]|uniref:Uncharacterized protein n=1 Tax=Solanum commersonii TaxID=4109 RepID=A0A9J6AGW4_SOLCO|nr:hypothetical protein H5410_008481 [Solanum commersonii]
MKLEEEMLKLLCVKTNYDCVVQIVYYSRQKYPSNIIFRIALAMETMLLFRKKLLSRHTKKQRPWWWLTDNAPPNC